MEEKFINYTLVQGFIKLIDTSKMVKNFTRETVTKDDGTYFIAEIIFTSDDVYRICMKEDDILREAAKYSRAIKIMPSGYIQTHGTWEHHRNKMCLIFVTRKLAMMKEVKFAFYQEFGVELL